MTDEEKQAKIDAINQLASRPSSYDPNATTKVFQDTGRQADSPDDVIDSYVGAPARTAISQMQQGNFSQALPSAYNQMGNDPQNAPSGQQLVHQAGITNPTAQKIAGAGLNMATDPMTFMGGPAGVSGTIEKVGAEEAAPAFSRVKQMFQIGDKTFPADNTAQALQIKEALENAGRLKPNGVLNKLNPGD